MTTHSPDRRFSFNPVGSHHRLVSVLATGLLVLTLVGSPLGQDRADAYMQEPHICADSSHSWKFGTVPAGSGIKQGWVRSSINTINDERNYDGNVLVSVTETSAGNLSVSILDQPAQNYGYSECIGSPSIWVNSNYTAASFYYKVTRHELGHLSGMSHGGKDDSMNGDNPATMSTCITPTTFSPSNILTQDDAAYLNWRWNTIADRQLHANVGFERGATYWGKTNGTITAQTSGGATGPGHVAFTASGTEWSSYIFQTIRLWTGTDNASYRAKINAKEPISSYSTSAMARLYRRTLSESGDNGCAYANGLENPNSASLGGTGYVLHAGTSMTAVSTSWVAVTSDWVNPANTDGLQLQIRAYGKAYTSTGGTGTIRFDNVRGEGK